MTRNQAVLDAIKILSTKKENEQTVKILREIYDELPIIHWTPNSVLDAFAQFIQDYGRLPTRGDFDETLPSRPTIKKIFNMSLVEFEQHYFPEHYKGTNKNSHYWWFTEKDFLDCFLDNYNTIRGGLYVKYADYDLYRKPGTPAIRLIIEKLGCNSYNELLQKTGVKKQRESFNIKSNKQTINISQEDVIV